METIEQINDRHTRFCNYIWELHHGGGLDLESAVVVISAACAKRDEDLAILQKQQTTE